MSDPHARHWSAYWASGFLTSLPEDFSANYDGEIAAFWERQFQLVPAAGRVLDVCTGNGAIALLAAQFAEGRDQAMHISAVDAAHIDTRALLRQHPQQAALLRKVEFLGGSPVEQLPFSSACFDLITSQYGVEYCRFPEAAEQLARVLKPGGRLAMISHASDSDILGTMQAERAEYSLLESIGLLDFLSEPTAAASNGQGQAERAGQLLAALQRQPGSGRSPLLGAVMRLLLQLRGLDQAAFARQQAGLLDYAQALRMALLRLEDMLRVNRLTHDDPDWFRVFERVGLKLSDTGELHYRTRHRAGRWFEFDRPRGASAGTGVGDHHG